MPQKIILKEAEATVDLTDNKNADKVTKNSPQNNSDNYSKAEEKSIKIAIDVLYILNNTSVTQYVKSTI